MTAFSMPCGFLYVLVVMSGYYSYSGLMAILALRPLAGSGDAPPI